MIMYCIVLYCTVLYCTVLYWRCPQEIWCQLVTAKEAATLQKKAPKVGGAGARKTYQQFTLLGYVVESLKKLVYFVSYVIALAMNLRACLLMELSLASFEFWTVRRRAVNKPSEKFQCPVLLEC